MSKSVFLKVTSAFMLGGAMAKAGEVVEVTNTEAKDLLSRGKAVLAVLDPADQLDEAVEVPAGEQVPEQAPEQPATEQAPKQPAAETPAPEAETKPAEAETKAAETETQPDAEPAKGKGKKAK